jgi:predicted kinase
VSVLYLLCGLSFSGKSTLGGLLAARTGAGLVSLDAINSRRGLRGGTGTPDEEWLATHRLALAQLERLCRAGGPVVVDDTNCFRWLRDAYRRVAAGFGYRSVVLMLDLPLAEALRRGARNERNGARAPVSRRVLVELAARFEPPASDEETVTVPAHVRFAPWLDSQLERGVLGGSAAAAPRPPLA